MKRFLLILVTVLGLAGCDSYLPDEFQSTPETCTVLDTQIVSHRAQGALAGIVVGHLLFDSGITGGIVGAGLAADTCTITVRATNGYVESLEASNVGLCRSLKVGDPIQVASIVRISYIERGGVKIETGRNRYRQL